ERCSGQYGSRARSKAGERRFLRLDCANGLAVDDFGGSRHCEERCCSEGRMGRRTAEVAKSLQLRGPALARVRVATARARVRELPDLQEIDGVVRHLYRNEAEFAAVGRA